jgi:hypothetical protein
VAVEEGAGSGPASGSGRALRLGLLACGCGAAAFLAGGPRVLVVVPAVLALGALGFDTHRSLMTGSPRSRVVPRFLFIGAVALLLGYFVGSRFPAPGIV